MSRELIMFIVTWILNEYTLIVYNTNFYRYIMTAENELQTEQNTSWKSNLQQYFPFLLLVEWINRVLIRIFLH